MKLNKHTKTFLWNLSNGLVAVGVQHLSGIDYVYIPIIIALMNVFTKELNRSFNPSFKERG